MQVAFIFLVVPSPFHLHFTQALEHAVVSDLQHSNLGPLRGDNCRTLHWDVEGGLDVQQKLVVRRCYSTSMLRPQLSQDAELGDTTDIELKYRAEVGQLVMILPATNATLGEEGTFTTRVYRVAGSSFSDAALDERDLSLPINGTFEYGALQPLFRSALKGTGCPLAQEDPTSCSTRFGETMTWTLQCANRPGNSHDALSKAFATMMSTLALHVDLRVSDRGSSQAFLGQEEGFAAAIGIDALLQQSAERRNSSSAQVFALYESMQGNQNVVASVVLSRINLATALIIAAIAALVWQLAQLYDRSAVAIALHCVAAHGAGELGEGMGVEKVDPPLPQPALYGTRVGSEAAIVDELCNV